MGGNLIMILIIMVIKFILIGCYNVPKKSVTEGWDLIRNVKKSGSSNTFNGMLNKVPETTGVTRARSGCEYTLLGCRGSRSVDKDHGGNIVLNSGHAIEDIINSGHTAEVGLNSGHMTEDIFNSGHTAEVGLNSGHTTEDIFNSGHTTEDIFNSGHTTEDIFNSGHTTEDIFNSGHTTEDGLNSGHATKVGLNLRHTTKVGLNSGHIVEVGSQSTKVFGLDTTKSNVNVNSVKYIHDGVKSDDATTASVEQLSPCKLTSNGNEATVDCRYLDLNHLSPAWFPESTTQIYLDNNNLMKIPDQIFNHLNRLEVLSISYNKIYAIDENAFAGLESLQILNLDMNQLDISEQKWTFRVFNPLKNLIELRLMFNKATYSRSITLPQSLYKLKLLTLRSNDDILYFGEDFKMLVDLHRLEISGSSTNITEQTFENVGVIRELYMNQFKEILNVDKKAFEPLKNLTVLLIDYFFIGVKTILRRLAPFKGRRMDMIWLSTVSFSSTNKYLPMYAQDGILSGDDLQQILEICVRNLIFRNNDIYYLQPLDFEQLKKWDQCLESLDISYNRFNLMNRLTPGIEKLLSLNHLQKFTFDNIVRSCHFHANGGEWSPFINYAEFKECSVFDFKYSENSKTLSFNRTLEEKGLTSFHNNVGSNSDRIDIRTEMDLLYYNLTTSDENAVTFNVSESITVINAGRTLTSCSLKHNVTLRGAHNVKYIDLTENRCVDFKGRILGLTGLESLILAGNNMAVLSDTFFKPMPSLRNLVMSACQLDSDQMSKKSDQIFGHLKNLVTLDLSSNSLHSLSKRTFDGNTELAFLNLTDNNFQYVPFDLAARPNLRELDLRGNLIASLSVRETQDMDALVSQFGSFNLHLSDNILSCGCQSLQFLQWLVMTRVTLDEDGNFTCMNDDGELTYTSEYRDLEKVWRHCRGTFYFALSLVLFCFMAVGFLTCYIVIKYKTFITCSLIQIVGGFKRKTKNEYDTGVFIGYADEEYRFPCIELREFIEKTLGLSTYIKDRDSPVSSNKANSLVTAINSSWRIVLVCSQPFLRDDQWAVFTMKWAMLSQTPANPARVIVLVREDLLDDLPAEVVSGVENESIIVLPSWELDYGVEQKLRTLLV